jgi:hypothetical protein
MKNLNWFLAGAVSVLAIEASLLGVFVLHNNQRIATEERISEQRVLARKDEMSDFYKQKIEDAQNKAKKAEIEIKAKYGLELTVAPVKNLTGSEISPTQTVYNDPIFATNTKSGQSYILLFNKNGGFDIFKQEKRYDGPFDTVVYPDKTVVATLDQKFTLVVETEEGYEIHLGDSKRDYRGFQRAYLATKVSQLKK